MTVHRPRPAAATVATWFLVVLLSRVAKITAFQTVPGSPCAEVCAGSHAGTLAQDVVCLDNLYDTSVNGSNFKECVACELNSTAVDTARNESDVEWGLCTSSCPCA